MLTTVYEDPIKDINLNFKLRTKPMIPPTLEDAKTYNLNIFHNGHLPYESGKQLINPFYVGDCICWASYAQGDEDPYYCLYYGGTNDLRIIENKNGIWKNIHASEIRDVHGFIWKMCTLSGLISKEIE